MFSLCEKWMARQTFKGSIQWIVVDDGHVPTDCKSGQEYIRVEKPLRQVTTLASHTVGANLSKALPLVRASKVLIIEDDDYYSPRYLQFMCDLLKSHELVGESGSKYYRLDNSTFEHFESKPFLTMAALARTGFSSKLIPYVLSCCPGDAQVDRRIWNFPGPKKLLEPSISGLHISVKCGPGRRSHNYSRALKETDKGGVQLLKWTQRDVTAVTEYRSLVRKVKDVVTYTALTDHAGAPYSKIKPPFLLSVEQVCVTNSAKELPGWTILRPESTIQDAGKLSRYWKCLAHELFPNAKYSVYVDASMQLLIDPLDLIRKADARWDDWDIVAVKHPYAKPEADWKVSDELAWIDQKAYAPKDRIAQQLSDYAAEGRDALSVSQCGLLIRKHTDKVKEFNLTWWNQIQKYGHRRDQPSFPVAAQLAGAKVREFEFSERENQFTKWFGHTAPRPTF